MNCTKSHSLIHLRESGDLTRREENRLDRHLDRCAECREYADGLEPLGLSEIGSDIPFGEDDFAGIRREVLAGLPVARHRNSRRSALQLAFLVAAALVVAIAFIQLRGTSGEKRIARAPGVERPSPPVIEEADARSMTPSGTEESTEEQTMKQVVEVSPREQIIPEPQSVRADAGVAHLEPQVVASAREEKGPLRIELRTNDPNIRIIWITSSRRSDSEGETDATISNS